MTVCVSVLLSLLGCCTVACIDRLSSSKLQSALTSTFASQRFTATEKQEAIRHIITEFEKYELTLEYNHLTSFTHDVGMNIIGILPGIKYLQSGDELIIIGAHYDTVPNCPGVVDNGSGVVALLEVARSVTRRFKHKQRKLTVLFVAFDFEETGLFGSSTFVSSWLLPLLDSSQSRLRGAVILDSVMNSDNSPHSQKVPQEFMTLYPTAHRALSASDYLGNYIQLVHRAVSDKTLSDRLLASTPHMLGVMPLAVPDDPVEAHTHHRTLINSDHKAFWFTGNPNVTLPAVYLTDTGFYRGSMQSCYHLPCDDKRFITKDNIQLLTNVVDWVERYLTRSISFLRY